MAKPFRSERWYDGYINRQPGLTKSEKAAAKALKTPGSFVGILTKLNNENSAHLRTLYIRLHAMSKVIAVKVSSLKEAEAAAAFYHFLLFKSALENRPVRSTRVEQKAKRVGWIETLSDLVRTEEESAGFKYLVSANRLDMSIEFFVLTNQTLFDKEVVKAALKKLSKYGTYYL